MNCLILYWLTTVLFCAQGCFKSAMYYRAKTRSRSHIFRPGENQPPHMEHTVEGSGPLDARDFQHSIPNKWLVRVDSPHIIFDSEEARWMTEGCRDRLIKLATQIQNTWAEQEVKLRVTRAWIKPPPNYKARPGLQVVRDEHVTGSGKNDDRDALLLYEGTSNPHSLSQHHEKGDLTEQRHSVNTDDSLRSRKKQPVHSSTRTNDHGDGQVLDLTPEMVVNEESQKSTQHKFFNNKGYGQPTITYAALDYAPGSIEGLHWTQWRTSRNKLTLHPKQMPIRSLNRRHEQGGTFQEGLTVSVNRLTRFQRNTISNKFNITSYAPTSLPHVRRMRGRSIAGIQFAAGGQLNPQVNTMTQLRYEQWLDLRMEEFHYAGRAVDVQLELRSLKHLRNKHVNMGVLAQMAYYVAQFDWCYFSRSGHVHCSVKPDSSITSQWFGCFPGSAKVTNENGVVIRMRDLHIGDRILTMDMTTNSVLPTPVVAFIHRDEHMWRPVVKITFVHLCNYYTLANGETSVLKLTPNHLIYVLRVKSGRSESVTVFASLVMVGDVMLVVPQLNGTLCKGIITNKTVQNEWVKDDLGVYAPLTQTGTLVVDNVLVSCFAHFSNERIAYVITLPLQLYFSISSWWTALQTKVYQNGIHWYTDWVYQLTSPFLPSWLFYSQT